MNANFKYLLAVTTLLLGCSADNDSNNDAGVEPPLELPTSLTALDGTTIESESLSCTYRQSFGASDLLELQLQYLDTPTTVSFALYLSEPEPSEPFSATAGQQGSFSFEVFQDGVNYSAELVNSEIEVQLDALPAPGSLSDGEVVSLNGRLLISQFSLLERVFTGEAGTRVLDLAAGTVGIDCETEFQLVQTVN